LAAVLHINKSNAAGSNIRFHTPGLMHQLAGWHIICLLWQTKLWEPGYDIFVLWFRPKTSSCRLPYQHHSSSTHCAWELFKGSKRISQSSSLHSKQNFLFGGCRFFVSDVIGEVVFAPFWLMLHGLWPNL